MNHRKRLLLLLAGLFVSLSLQTMPVRAQGQNELADSGLSPAPYRTGEKLTYNVSFSNFPTAGHIELMVWGRGTYFGRAGIELRARVETTGIVSAALYSINNNYFAYIDPATGLPFRTQQVIREGSRNDDVSLDYNQPAGVSALPSKSTPFGASGTYDFLSAFYRLRALPLAQGATYRIAVRNDSAQYDAVLQVMGREIIKTNVGSSNAIVTQLRVPGNKAANDYSIRIYFTDDERHIPVLISLRLKAGEIRAELASAEILTEPTPDGNPLRNPSTNAPLVASRPTAPPGATIPDGDSVAAAPAVQGRRTTQLQLLSRRRRAVRRHGFFSSARPRQVFQPRRLFSLRVDAIERCIAERVSRQQPFEFVRRCHDAASLSYRTPLARGQAQH